MADTKTNQLLAAVAPGAEKKVVRSRVWRACEICRKRKIKCDGQDPCAFCSLNKKECTFKDISDNASSSRQHATLLDERVSRIEEILAGFIPMSQAWAEWTHQQPVDSSTQPGAGAFFGQVASGSLPIASGSSNGNRFNPASASALQRSEPYQLPPELRAMIPSVPFPPPSSTKHENEETGIDELLEKGDDGNGVESWSDRFSHLTKDSLGNLRYIGGATSFVLVEALRSLQQETQRLQAEDQVSPSNTVDSQNQAVSSGSKNLELPFFRKGMHFRAFAKLPRVEETELPPREVADSLVAVYFDRIHPLFPVLQTQTFLKKYAAIMSQTTPLTDHPFLSVLFAVFAAAANLTTPPKKTTSDGKQPQTDQGFQWTSQDQYGGLEFYEQSQLLLWIGSRGVSLENVQCLSILALCHAGWNTLAQAWNLTGQAYRASQDLGLHRDPKRLRGLTKLEKEERRGVWWAVYSMDKVLSIQLGRPQGGGEEEWDTVLPSELDDHQLYLASLTTSPSVSSVISASSPASSTSSSYMTGWVAYLKISVLAGKIVRKVNSLKLLREMEDPAKAGEIAAMVANLDGELDAWIDHLPHSVKFAANETNNPKMLTLCLLGFLLYYSSCINLHRPFIPDPRDATQSSRADLSSLMKCVSAAKSCIRIGDMVKELLPSSHHLAYSVQYITISGVILLRCIIHVNDPLLVEAVLKDATQCVKILESMEEVWNGAKRCREIVTDLLVVAQQRWLKMSGASNAHQEPSPSAPYTPFQPQTSTTNVNTGTKRPAGEDLRSPQASRARFDMSVPTNHPLYQHQPSGTADSLLNAHLVPSPSPNAFNYTAQSPQVDFNTNNFSSTGTSNNNQDQIEDLFSGFDFLENDLPAIFELMEGRPQPQGSTGGLVDEENGKLLWEALQSGTFGQNRS